MTTVAECSSLMMRKVTKAVLVGLLGILIGASSIRGSSHCVPPVPSSSESLHYVSEYDLIPTYTFPDDDATPQPSSVMEESSPANFENAMRSAGVTDAEYAACNSSIYQEPNRRVCVKVGKPVCYKKKVKVLTDESGETASVFLKEGAVELPCPYDVSENERPSWPSECYYPVGGAYSNRQIICYYKLPCQEEVSQWSATELSIEIEGTNSYVDTMEGTNSLFLDLSFVGWNGGPDPANITDYDNVDWTNPYEGKFCLQKAGLKALSRNGWELIEPYDAFTAYTWKVIRRTPLH